jgi:hypothetical protein
MKAPRENGRRPIADLPRIPGRRIAKEVSAEGGEGVNQAGSWRNISATLPVVIQRSIVVRIGKILFEVQNRVVVLVISKVPLT